MHMTCGRRAYPSDLSDEEWERLRPLIPEPSTDGRPAEVPRRELINAMLSLVRSGCAWRLLPHDLPAWKTVYHYFRLWQRAGLWQKIMDVLREEVRAQMGRERTPSAAIIDAQSIKSSAVRGPEKGYDGAKKNQGAQTSPLRG